VLSELALAKYPDGTTPDPMEIVRLTTFLFAAGQDTTARFLASALRIIAENPWIEDRLRADRALVPEFIEEAMRLEGPTKSEGRLVKVSTELGGLHLPAGTPLTLILSAVNRDPRRFEAPNEFRFGRPRAMEHLGFGRGAHTCAGAPLARAETKVSLNRFLDRFSKIAISEEHHGPADARRLRYAETYVFRGLQRLHLDLTPA
jgi:cytochrome P450